ncbi:glycosyltransferase family 9 protein [Schlegelella sp. S2-27]|uniref:Glycosyltransferase family 9 protein n=1 Tax=Caldimonas mangrovi TaxID=2944811 RepID=A0ABT0YL59_9BURK|nr:glycosyltransferase family 9 protein [Caldimonas mangrovi]MCM5679455.1 glycosyltransferase family 9 protein [Caldimonas mangrovi]
MNRILVIRLSALGDVVMASGLIPALRQLHPQAHLAWLVEPAAAPLLRHNPRLDEVIVWPRGEWQALWRQRRLPELWRRARDFRRELKSRRFDLVIDAQGLLKSAVWARLTGAPRRISLIGHEGSHRLMTERAVPPPNPTKPIGNEYRFLAKYLGAPASSFQLDLALGAAARDTAAGRLQAAGAVGRFAALCPFTTRPQKHWFEDRWAALALRLKQAGLVPVLLGGPSDAEAAARITAAAPGAVNLAGALKLDETAAAIARCSVLIGVDTGLTHMGTALKVPTVALFGSTRPYLDARTPTTRIMYERLDCSPCHRHPTCDDRFDCMRLHSVDAVYAQALGLLEAQP